MAAACAEKLSTRSERRCLSVAMPGAVVLREALQVTAEMLDALDGRGPCSESASSRNIVTRNARVHALEFRSVP